MTGLYIFLGIVLFFVFIFTLKIKVVLDMPSPEDISLIVKILGIPIRILPSKPKRIKLSRYSKKAMEKRRLAETEKAKLKAKKKEEKKQKKLKKEEEEKARLEKLKKEGKTPPEKKEKKYDPTAITLVDNINAATAALGKFFVRFGRRFRIDVSRIVINVATGDAASTAIMYGATVPAVMALIALLEKITNLKGIDKADIRVKCDYLSSSTTVDVKIAFSIRPYHLFDMLFSALFRFLGRRGEIKKEKNRLHQRRLRAAEIIERKMQARSQANKQDKKAPEAQNK